MGFFDGLVNWASNVVRNVVYGIGTIVGATAALAVDLIEVARDTYREYRKRHGAKAEQLAQQEALREIHNINNEIIDLERKRERDGRLGEYDQHRLTDLYQKRSESRDRVHKATEMELARNIEEGNGQYGNLLVTDKNLHVLQYHQGQTVFGKHCRRCGRPMILNWRLQQTVSSMTGYGGFFWSCTGYYESQCKNTEQFLQTDMSLFTRIDRPEFDVSNQELTRIALLPGSQRLITRRMGEMKHEANDVYLCPVHQEPMVLQEKNNAEGILDMYFLGCPRWKPGGQGCSQVVKLKSPAQLASYLESSSGRGLM
jgi:hypothetical protein